MAKLPVRPTAGLEVDNEQTLTRELGRVLLSAALRRGDGSGAGEESHDERERSQMTASRSTCGSDSVNVEPAPGTLATVMSPPILRARSRLIASPSPVPDAG